VVWKRGLELRFGNEVSNRGLELQFGNEVSNCGSELRFGIEVIKFNFDEKICDENSNLCINYCNFQLCYKIVNNCISILFVNYLRLFVLMFFDKINCG